MRNRKQTIEPPTVTESMAYIMDQMAAVRAACTGYRATLEADGYSPTMAEYLAGNLHVHLVRCIFGATT